jgi:hypothetical protein
MYTTHELGKQYGGGLAVINPTSSNAMPEGLSDQTLNELFWPDRATGFTIYGDGQPTALNIQEAYDDAGGNGLILFTSGGDGTVKEFIETAYNLTPGGQVPDYQLAVIKKSLLVPHAAGNACNLGISALGAYARNLGRLARATDLGIADHAPFIVDVLTKDGEVRSTEMAHSGVGLGLTAAVARRLDKAKPGLKRLSPRHRLLRETMIAASTALQTEPTEMTITWNHGDRQEGESLPRATGAELIATNTYAKQIKSPALHIGSILRQPAVSEQPERQLARTAALVMNSLRLTTGRHTRGPVAFNPDTAFSITLGENNPDTPYHLDGELHKNGEPYELHPGESLRIRIAQVPIPVLVQRRHW